MEWNEIYSLRGHPTIIFQLKRLYKLAITIYLSRMRFAISLLHSSNHSIRNERRIYR